MAKGDEWKIEVTGGPEAARAILSRKKIVIPALVRAFQDRGRRVQRRLALYPEQPSGSTYRRTGTLGRRWQMRSSFTRGRIMVNVYNPTEYGPYVQGDDDQAWMHRGTWETEVQALRAESDAIVEAVSDAMIRALR